MNTKHLNKIALALVCLGAASTSLTALAVQPSATPTTPRNAPITAQVLGITGLEAPATANIGSPVKISIVGAGLCEFTFDSGEDQHFTWKGPLPFSFPWIYKGYSMSSFDAFKKVNASVTPATHPGNCKTTGKGPFTVEVKVVNPHPQSAGAPPQENTVAVAGSGKPGETMKPDIAAPSRGVPPPPTTPPVVPPTITSISVSGNAVTGAPITVPSTSGLLTTLATGSATTLTVNGTGNCKYQLSYVNLDANGNMIVKSYPMMANSSSLQSPFPMTMTVFPTTLSGIYKWSVSGIDGCAGTRNVTFAVQ